MSKIEADLQHVSIFRVGNVYLIGVLYDFQGDNQEGSADIIVQGNHISVWIEEADGPMKERTAMATATVHIVSATGPIPCFKVRKSAEKEIIVPVFSLSKLDGFKVAGELSSLSSVVKQTLTVIPESGTDLPDDIAAELGLKSEELALAREWGWGGW